MNCPIIRGFAGIAEQKLKQILNQHRMRSKNMTRHLIPLPQRNPKTRISLKIQRNHSKTRRFPPQKKVLSRMKWARTLNLPNLFRKQTTMKKIMKKLMTTKMMKMTTKTMKMTTKTMKTMKMTTKTMAIMLKPHRIAIKQ